MTAFELPEDLTDYIHRVAQLSGESYQAVFNVLLAAKLAQESNESPSSDR